jgi:hypothetical protein
MDMSEIHEKRTGGRPALWNSKGAQVDAKRSNCRPQQLPAWLLNLQYMEVPDSGFSEGKKYRGIETFF